MAGVSSDRVSNPHSFLQELTFVDGVLLITVFDEARYLAKFSIF
jgi:hypothetical protein